MKWNRLRIVLDLLKKLFRFAHGPSPAWVIVPDMVSPVKPPVQGVHAKHVRWLTARVPAGGQPRGRGLASTVTTDNIFVYTAREHNAELSVISLSPPPSA